MTSILACGSVGFFGSPVGLIGFVVLLLVATIVWGILYGLSRIWCRPKWARRLAIVGLVVSVLAGLPGLATAQLKARRTSGNCCLKQIGMALAQFSADHKDILPADLQIPELMYYLGNAKVLTDPVSGKLFIYLGTGHVWQSNSDDIIACSPSGDTGRNVLFNDGHVEWLSNESFAAALRRSGQQLPPESP